MQNAEMTEYYIYSNLAKKVKSKEDAEILQRIADEEYAHAKIWGGYTKEQSKPNKAKIGWYTLLATVLGYTFVLKKMEQGEDNAQKTYDLLFKTYPETKQIYYSQVVEHILEQTLIYKQITKQMQLIIM